MNSFHLTDSRLEEGQEDDEAADGVLGFVIPHLSNRMIISSNPCVLREYPFIYVKYDFCEVLWMEKGFACYPLADGSPVMIFHTIRFRYSSNNVIGASCWYPCAAIPVTPRRLHRIPTSRLRSPDNKVVSGSFVSGSPKNPVLR